MDHGRSIRGRAAWIAVAVCAFAFSFGAVQAEAASYKWHKHTIRYQVGSKDPNVVKTLQISAALWNDLGLKIKLVRTTSSRKADIKVKLRNQSFFATPFIMGTGQLPGSDKASALDLTRDIFYDRKGSMSGPSQAVAVAIATHELGHTLGLMHRNGCSIMRPSAGEPCGPAAKDGDTMLCGPTPSDYKALKKKYGRRGGKKPSYHTCTSAFKKFGWYVPPPKVDGTAEWSIDGVNWTAATSQVPVGTDIWVRHAVSADKVVFPLYAQMVHEIRLDYTGGSWFEGGMPPESACIARTSATGAPTATTPCEKAEGFPAGAGREFQAAITRAHDRYWLVAKYKMDQPGAAMKITTGVRLYTLPESQRFTSAGVVTITTPGFSG